MSRDLAPRAKVLVMHALRPTSRQTTIDHLLSFREHLPHCDVQYLHFQQPVPEEIGVVAPDLMVVNYDYLNYRFSPLWPYIKRRHRAIARRAGRVVAIAQDDFWANKLLDNWCMDWDVDRILTPIDNDRDVLYPRSSRTKEFRTGLTGYVRSGPAPETALLADRHIDLGQRVRDMPPHLGRLAQAKATQAVAFAAAAKEAGFTVDVSTRVEDSFIGPAWFSFLASCRFTVGMKGGASLHDPYGLIHTKVQAHLARYPDARFDDLESRCFPGKDMKHEFSAISPRLFESALAGTCQVLQRDDYLGVLQPWRDYLPLEKDMSNVDEVLAAMRDLDRCQEIVRNARIALVDSGIFDYSRLVETATKGLLAPRGDVDHQWQSLSEYLRRSAEAFSGGGPELHDAALHLISEEVLPNARGRRGVTAEIEVGSSTAPREVIRYLEREGKLAWFDEIARIMMSDPVSTRAPWIWRPVPVGKSE